MINTAANIETRVERITESGCWIWLGSSYSNGYGRLSFNGKERLAHRVFFEVFKGIVPDGFCVLHRCDVRCCVNPDHLRLGTKAENSQDMAAKGRQKCPARLRTHCPQGHEYSGVNAVGARICRICNSKATLAHYYRSKNK